MVAPPAASSQFLLSLQTEAALWGGHRITLAAMAESAGLTRRMFQQDLDYDGDTQGLLEHEGRCKYIARMRLTWAKCSKLVIGGRASVTDSTLSRIQLVDTYIGSCTSHVLQMICKLAYSQPTKYLYSPTRISAQTRII